MAGLTRYERNLILILVFVIIAGIAWRVHGQMRPPRRVSIGKYGAALSARSAGNDAGMPAYRININTASAEELEELGGIGKTIARRIVDYREANGAFGSVDELARVKGVSGKVLERNRERITVDQTRERTAR